MVRHNAGAVLRQICTLLDAGTCCGLSDRQLLDRFLARRDEVSELAFTVLVERHGPMVLGVCRRILADPHDAEDAFQATFLVLVRKARSIRVEGSVGRWLFGVATRVAARAKADALRRRGRERSGLDRLDLASGETSEAAVEQADLRAILAEELGKLPMRLQAPVILCDLEGSSHEEAARRLGLPVGTVKSRLSRARARLRDRLTRRGLAPSDLSIAMPLVPTILPRGLVEATTRAAQSLITSRIAAIGIVSTSVATLTEGVLRTMLVTKLKLAAALLLIAAGSAALVSQATAQKPAARQSQGIALTSPAAPATRADEAAPRDDELDIVMLEHAWVEAIPRGDAAIVNRILADDFEEIRAPLRNIITKAAYMSDLRNGIFTALPRELEEIKVRLFGETAVATSRIRILRADPSLGRLETHVYVKRQGRWQCVASHGSWASGVTWEPMKPTDTLPQAGGPMAQMMRMRMGGVRITPADQLTRIWPPFNCRVEKVHIRVGRTVKKGDPLVDVFSTDLAEAKSQYEIAVSQWLRDKKILDYKTPLALKGTLARKELIEVESDEAQSRLKMKLTKDKLLIYGLTEDEIEKAKGEDGMQKARLTLRSPVDGIVFEVGAVPGNYYDTKDVLMAVHTTPSEKPAAP